MKKDIDLKTLANYTIHPAFIALAICAIIILEMYFESMCLSYAKRTYNYLPLYGVRIAFCLMLAVSVRIFIALKRKKSYKGKVIIMLPALILVLVLVMIGAFDWVFLTKKLIWNQMYDVFLILSILCIIMRKQ